MFQIVMVILARDITSIPGHPAELSDSVKLPLKGVKSHEFEIDLVLKSIHFVINFKYMTATICE